MKFARGRGTATILLADVSSDDAQDKLADDAWAWKNRLDIWVNNAGADVLTGEAANWSFEENLRGSGRSTSWRTMRLLCRVGRRMQTARHRGAILNIGWDQADTGMAGDSGEISPPSKGPSTAFTRASPNRWPPKSA